MSKGVSKYEPVLRKLRTMKAGTTVSLKSDDPVGYRDRLYQAILRDRGCQMTAERCKARFRMNTSGQGVVVMLLKE